MPASSIKTKNMNSQSPGLCKFPRVDLIAVYVVSGFSVHKADVPGKVLPGKY